MHESPKRYFESMKGPVGSMTPVSIKELKRNASAVVAISCSRCVTRPPGWPRLVRELCDGIPGSVT